tara:strand:- start:669 stop:839 length:171 start_codon:yes stop_codon:yes gene_type:complete
MMPNRDQVRDTMIFTDTLLPKLITDSRGADKGCRREVETSIWGKIFERSPEYQQLG